MARLTARRRAWVAVGMITGLAALSVGAWALREWQPFGPSAAAEWPTNVAPLARYVESTTGLHFHEVLPVEFIADPAAFAERVQRDDDPTDETKALAAADEAVGRALGFWAGDPQLIESAHRLRTSGDSAVEWIADEHVVVVRAKNGSSALTPIDRAELVLTLTQVIDDQQYDIGRRLDATDTAQEFQALAGMAIGEAVWVRDRYVDGFGDADDTDYQTALTDRGRSFSDAVDDVNPAFRSLRVAGQTVGTAFVAALHASADVRALDTAFTDSTPEAVDQMTMPTRKYFHRDRLEPVDAPPVPSDAEYVSTRQMGPFAVFLVLAGGQAPTTALDAADGWGNDAFTTYRLAGRVCVDARIVADSPQDADRLEAGLQAWGRARPTASDALVGRDGTTLLLSACDPGVDATQTVVDGSQIDQFLTRADLLRQQVHFTGRPGLSECIAVRFFSELGAADLRGENPDVDPFEEMDRIDFDCRTSV